MEGVLYIGSFCMGAVGAWLVSRLAESLGLLDHPNGRSSHRRVTPRGGGIGIFAAFLLCALLSGVPQVFWLPLSVMAVLALLGDRFEIPPKFRLAGQFVFAGILVAGSYGPGRPVLFIVAAVFLWSVFIVGTANFYNFMDGINGIAALTGTVGFGLLAIYLHMNGVQAPSENLALSISLACLGFLPLNMPKAKIFMGDIGSILLGAAFGGLVFLESRTLLDFVCMASFLFPFYADELTTMVVRLRDGDNLFRAHRKHIYQLLANEMGIAHWKVSAGYGLLQLLVGLSVLAMKDTGLFPVLGMLVIYFAGFCAAGYRIRSNAPLPQGLNSDMSSDN